MPTPRRRTASPVTKILRPFKETQVFDANAVLTEAYHLADDRRSARLIMSARLKLLSDAAESMDFSAPKPKPKPARKKKVVKPVEEPVVEVAVEPEPKPEWPKPKPKTNALDLNDAAMLLFAATAEDEEPTDEPSKPEPKKSSAFDPSSLDVLGELGDGFSDEQDENEVQNGALDAENTAEAKNVGTAIDEPFAEEPVVEKPTSKKVDLGNSFAELSALAAMSADEETEKPDSTDPEKE